jgi:hypothetical protein
MANKKEATQSTKNSSKESKETELYDSTESTDTPSDSAPAQAGPQAEAPSDSGPYVPMDPENVDVSNQSQRRAYELIQEKLDELNECVSCFTTDVDGSNRGRLVELDSKVRQVSKLIADAERQETFAENRLRRLQAAHDGI